MKITVDRKVSNENELVFTITCTEPHKGPFGLIEQHMMEILDTCKTKIQNIPTQSKNQEKMLQEDIVGLMHVVKEQAFLRIRNSLSFAIENQLRIKWSPILQEIYNWIFDSQDEPLKQWIQEFHPERTKYYFDNDKTIENYSSQQDHDDVEVDDDDEDD